ncbi:hypothetical protein C5167_037286 [Papaver somniferum]|uniref:Uncharacterized protein n=1 Tax=Papaver somniferum TaxID=3469 RepID=A0A4Y7I8G6_PAPSO|nr:hypothetical protein C5167_037286 [Papaver somniferum]
MIKLELNRILSYSGEQVAVEDGVEKGEYYLWIE